MAYRMPPSPVANTAVSDRFETLPYASSNETKVIEAGCRPPVRYFSVLHRCGTCQLTNQLLQPSYYFYMNLSSINTTTSDYVKNVNAIVTLS